MLIRVRIRLMVMLLIIYRGQWRMGGIRLILYIVRLAVLLKVRHGLILREGFGKKVSKKKKATAEEYQVGWLKYGSKQRAIHIKGAHPSGA